MTSKGECQNTSKHHIHECQEFRPFPAGDHKAARNRHDSMTRNTNKKHGPQKKHRLGMLSKKITGGLIMFDGTNLTLISNVVQYR